MADHTHQQLDRVSSADGVFSVGQILGETFLIVFLDEVHALVVHVFDELPDLPFTVEGLEIEVVSPVAKITRYDKYCVLVIEIGR